MHTAAFFDIDGTLIRCVTQNELMKLLLKEKYISHLRAAEIAVWFILYKLGRITNTVPLRKKAYGLFCGARHDQITAMFDRVWENSVKPKIRMDMVKKVEEHRQAGDLIFAISGSIMELCAPVCHYFGIQNYFATQLSLKDGVFTGEWTGPILEGTEKSILIKKLAAIWEIDLSRSSAYADSYSDLSMLSTVGHPIAVDPDPRLRKHARTAGWKII